MKHISHLHDLICGTPNGQFDVLARLRLVEQLSTDQHGKDNTVAQCFMVAVHLNSPTYHKVATLELTSENPGSHPFLYLDNG